VIAYCAFCCDLVLAGGQWPVAAAALLMLMLADILANAAWPPTPRETRSAQRA